MPQYDVEVKFTDISGPDALSARLSVEEKLRAAGFQHWQVVGIAPHARSTIPTGSVPPLRSRRSSAYVGSALLVAAVAAWVLWFLWVLTG